MSTAPQVMAHERALNGIPPVGDDRRGRVGRLVRNPFFWLSIGLTLLYAACMVIMYLEVSPDTPVPGGVMPGLNAEALRRSALWALPTLAFWVIVFLWADRFRPQRWVLWYLALGWGAAVATCISLYVNTWAAARLGISGDGDPTSGARAAIFIAPFVEEAAKATVLFFVGILLRYRIVSRLSGITLAGLSAAGFAFTENIIYYARVIVYASMEISVGDVDKALRSIVLLRGLITCFGHPLFTMMIGIGVAVAARTRSRVVRVLAPLVGFLVAALLHMLFNSQASLSDDRTQKLMYFVVALPLVAMMVIFCIRQLFRESGVIRTRLTDYVRMGWLREHDPIHFSRLRMRLRALLIALGRGWSSFSATIRMQRAQTELAYLRDSMTRGIVDGGGLEREKELLHLIRDLRGRAIDDVRGLRLLPSKRGTSQVDAGWAPPSYPGPAGIGGNFPAPTGIAPSQPPVGSPHGGSAPVNPHPGAPRS